MVLVLGLISGCTAAEQPQSALPVEVEEVVIEDIGVDDVFGDVEEGQSDLPSLPQMPT